MQATVYPSRIQGTIQANPSKSHAQRLIALAALAEGKSVLHGIGNSADVAAAIRIAESIGAGIAHKSQSLEIRGGLSLKNTIWECGESGLCMRMFAPVAALYGTEITLEATGTLLKRPVHFMQETFASLGVTFHATSGHPPISITGPFEESQGVVNGSNGSQFLTGLLIALPLCADDTTLKVSGLTSKPYIDLTLSAMRAFGVDVSHDQYETFRIPGNQTYTSASISVHGDWSGMAFLIVAATLQGEVRIHGLSNPEEQPDGQILDAIDQCGAEFRFTEDALLVTAGTLKAFTMDCTDCPDLFPPLVALAVHCAGTSKIHGVHRLKSKESDREFALISEFARLGAKLMVEDDSLVIHGGASLHAAVVDAHDDHRIAMALSIAAIGSQGPVTISGVECITKSYPGFFSDLQELGAAIQLTAND